MPQQKRHGGAGKPRHGHGPAGAGEPRHSVQAAHLCELVTVLWFQVPLHALHELAQAGRQVRSPVRREGTPSKCAMGVHCSQVPVPVCTSPLGSTCLATHTVHL